MGKDTNIRRQKLADEIRKLSELMTMVLAGRIKWTCRDVIDPRARDADAVPESLARDLFEVAQDVASGRIELDMSGSHRPLFDRPSADGKSFDPEPTPNMLSPGVELLMPVDATARSFALEAYMETNDPAGWVIGTYSAPEPEGQPIPESIRSCVRHPEELKVRPSHSIGAEVFACEGCRQVVNGNALAGGLPCFWCQNKAHHPAVIGELGEILPREGTEPFGYEIYEHKPLRGTRVIARFRAATYAEAEVMANDEWPGEYFRCVNVNSRDREDTTLIEFPRAGPDADDDLGDSPVTPAKPAEAQLAPPERDRVKEDARLTPPRRPFLLPELVVPDPEKAPISGPKKPARKLRKSRAPKSWTIIDAANGRDTRIGTIQSPSGRTALQAASERHPGLMHLKVEPAEATPAPEPSAGLAKGSRIVWTDHKGKEWAGKFQFQLGRFAKIVLDREQPAGTPAVIHMQVNPESIRPEPSKEVAGA